MTPSHREKRKNRRLRRIAVLPSLVTLLSVVCGFAAIHFTARGMNEPDRLWFENPELTYFAAAAWFIFLAIIADGLDGYLARASRGSSSFGGQLDSLADMVSFGIAPAFLMLRVVESSLPGIFSPASPAFGSSIPGKLLWLIAAMYACCTALRLARFNVEHEESHESAHIGFRGLPSPAAAGVVASLVLLYGDLGRELQQDVPMVVHIGSLIVIYALPLITVAAALLMVSRIPYVHLINQYLRGRRSFGHIVMVVFLIFFLIVIPQLTMAIAFVTYAFVSALRWLWTTYIRKNTALSGEKRDTQKESNAPANP